MPELSVDDAPGPELPAEALHEDLRLLLAARWHYQRGLLVLAALVATNAAVAAVTFGSAFWLPTFGIAPFTDRGWLLHGIPHGQNHEVLIAWEVKRRSLLLSLASPEPLASSYFFLVLLGFLALGIAGFVSCFLVPLLARPYFQKLLMLASVLANALNVIFSAPAPRLAALIIMAVSGGMLLTSVTVHLSESVSSKTRRQIPSLLFCFYGFAALMASFLNRLLTIYSHSQFFNFFLILIAAGLPFSVKETYVYYVTQGDFAQLASRLLRNGAHAQNESYRPAGLWPVINSVVESYTTVREGRVVMEDQRSLASYCGHFIGLVLIHGNLVFVYVMLTASAQIYQGRGSFWFQTVGLWGELLAYLLMLLVGARCRRRAINVSVAAGLICLSIAFWLTPLLRGQQHIAMLAEEALVVAMRFLVCMNFCTSYNYIMEVFPYIGRHATITTSIAYGFMAASATGLLSIVHNFNPLKVFGVSSALALIAALLLPETLAK